MSVGAASVRPRPAASRLEARLLAAFAGGLLLTGFSAIVDPPDDPRWALNERFVGCFCADPAARLRDFICIVPGDDVWVTVRGSGAGLLPDLAPTAPWDFSGGSIRASFDVSRLAQIEIWREDGAVGEYEAILADDDTLALRERYGPWQSEPPLRRCPS